VSGALARRDVVLVDGGGTNIGSVRYALQRLGVDAEMTADPDRISGASHVILPGVGAAGPGMAKLHEAGLTGVLRALRQPLLGVCLGMQLLFERSEEGDTECLGILPGSATHFPQGNGLRIPHMGWNRLRIEREDPLLDGIGDEAYAYFVHSYAAPTSAATLASTDHGIRFSAIVRHGNVCGMQFHPERSAAVGARLLHNFLGLE
jgi:imidazole glycerol-phosphate synthase subunit HisH